MRHATIPAVLAIFALAASPGGARAQADYTDGYVRRDGTQVQGYYHTAPNDTRLDNYSTRGNVNPFTGRAGDVAAYRDGR